MSAQEFAEWMAYYRIDPWDASRDDLRSALVCTVIANGNRSKKSRPFKVNDFLLNFREANQNRQVPEQDPKAMQSQLIALTRALGGEVRESPK
jgi:hypothetical protein